MPIQRSTRLNKTQEREARKALVKYVFLTVALLAFLGLVGLPLIIPQVTQLIEDTAGRNAGSGQNDTTPPPPPRLNDIPRHTKENSVDISGTTEAGSTVYIIVNGHDTELIANAEGGFSSQVELSEGENEIYAFAEDQAQNKSGESQKYTVSVDKEAPKLEIIKPSDGSIFFGQEDSVQIEGQTDPGISIRVSDRVAIVNRDGKFTVNVQLNEGSNNYEIVATDEAGNETKTNLTLSYTP